VVTAAAGLAVDPEDAYHWSLYLLLAGWPLAVYAGARLLGLDRWQSAGAAVLAPWLRSAPGYGYESGSYTWQGLGIWPQLWAAWLLPVAIGLGWRAVSGKSSAVLAGLAVAACTLCHFLTGWLALAVVALMPVLHGADVRRRFGRLGVVLASAAAAVAWFVVPMLLDGDGADYSGYERGTFWYDSFGATRVLKWLLAGDLFDQGRLPIVTALAAVGLVLTVVRARHDIGARVVLLLSGLSLVLFFGRPTLGPLLGALPFGGDLFYPRFIIGVQLGGVLLAGIGAAWLGAGAVRFAPAAGVAVLAAIVIAPVVRDGVRVEDQGRGFIATQRAADADGRADVIGLIRSVRREPGRVFAGAHLGWGATYRVGYVPIYAELLDQEVDAVGWQLRVSSLATEAESHLDETDPAQLDELGVRWLLLPADRAPTVPATLVAERGDHRLYEVTGSPGYARIVDGRGDVDRAVVEPASGRFAFRVSADRPSELALAASWHPRWQATLDGERAEVLRRADGLIGVRVGEGQHDVTFEYVPFAYTWVLVALGALALVGLSRLRSLRASP
jgi:hypothetical protein